MKYDKKFLIIGNMNAITYKEIFPLIKNDEMWLGVSRNGCGQMYFLINEDMPEAKGQIVVDGQKYQTIGSSAWFTNLDHNKRHEEIVLTKRYNEDEYQKYDNYDAIDVSKVVNLPNDYDGVMGVPITFLGKYCPEQFQIIKFRKGDDNKDLSVNGKCPYFRILIKHKKCLVK